MNIVPPPLFQILDPPLLRHAIHNKESGEIAIQYITGCQPDTAKAPGVELATMRGE